MFTDHRPQLGGAILDLTPALVPAAPQDWDFNAHSGIGSFEWDILNPRAARSRRASSAP